MQRVCKGARRNHHSIGFVGLLSMMKQQVFPTSYIMAMRKSSAAYLYTDRPCVVACASKSAGTVLIV